MALPAPIQNVKTLLSRFTLQQKMSIAASGAVVMGMMWLAVFLSNRVDFQVVFADLDPSEAQGIVQKLQDLKVPYQLSTDSRSISVASEKASEVRIQLASQGLPSSGRVGFEIFDQTNFGLTNFQEQVNYQRALEGELARSIMTLTEVDVARVHLVLPKDSLFQSAEDQTKASVILKLKNGRNLSDNAVQGIINLVASSVKGLTPEKVTLIDYRGKVLARPESNDALTGKQLGERQNLENELATKIIQILEPAVGHGKVRPQVSVSMSFQQVEETTERYDPEGSVIRSQQKLEERQPPNQIAAGIPGPKGQVNPVKPAQGNANAAAQPAATPPTVTPAPATPENTLPTKKSEVINYEVSKSIRHSVEPVGKLNRVSVAVIIDNHSKTVTGTDGNPQTTSEPRTPEEMTKYRDIVAATVGFNAERGDKLTIENVSFAGEIDVVKEPTFIERQGPIVLTGLRYLIIPMAFVLIYLLFLRPVKKVVFATLSGAAGSGGSQIASGQLVKSLPNPAFPKIQTPMTVKQLEAQLQSGSTQAQLDEYKAGLEMLPIAGTSKMEIIRDRVIEHASQDPETVARLVRVWLNDDKK